MDKPYRGSRYLCSNYPRLSCFVETLELPEVWLLVDPCFDTWTGNSYEVYVFLLRESEKISGVATTDCVGWCLHSRNWTVDLQVTDEVLVVGVDFGGVRELPP
jgi:hypothetical protein